MLKPGNILNHDQSIKSPNKKFTAIMQEDGNFVIYNIDGRAIWKINGGRNHFWSPFHFVLQDDCNLVVYGRRGAHWSSGTSK